MKEVKQHLIQSQHQRIDPDWQFFNGLELLLGSDAELIIHGWLTKSLEPLYLQIDFLNKVLKSAQETLVRVTRAEPVMKIEQIYILLFVQAKRSSEGQSWGFFRVERAINQTKSATALGQTVEFYLYLEGQ